MSEFVDNNPDLVLDVLLETVKAHPEVLAEPAPVASLRDVTANAVNYQLTYAVNEPLRLNVVKGDLYRRIWKRFVELHIQIK